MSAALYWWRGTWRSSWRAAVTVALLTGLLGAIVLGSLAGARRTASAYGRYLASINASDVFVNVPRIIPGLPRTRPIELTSRLPGIAASSAYLGLVADPVVRGRVDDAFQDGGLTGSFAAPGVTAGFLRQDRVSVLAGRQPGLNSVHQIVLTPGLARLFRVGVGGQVTYELFQVNPLTYAIQPAGRRRYTVTGIVDLPPVLGDQSDQIETGILPPAATAQVLSSYEFAWVGLRLDHGTAGIPALQRELAGLAASLQRQVKAEVGGPVPALNLDIRNAAVIRGEVRQAITPQSVALAAFGGIAGLALLVLAGQGLAQLLGRSGPDLAVAVGLGASRRQAALAASLPGAVAIVAGTVLALAGAIALSPLAPVGPVRQFDPVRGAQADGLVLGAGSAVMIAALLTVLAVMAVRGARRPPPPRGQVTPSGLARAAAAAGLPSTIVVGSRNALEPGAGRPVPVRAMLVGSVAAVTAVVAAVVFGTSLTSLLTHPARFGWNWNVLLQTQDGYGNFYPDAGIRKLVEAEPAVAAWSQFGFSQAIVDGQVVPVLGVETERGAVEPPTTGGRPLTGDSQVELGSVTLRELGKKIGDTVEVGMPGHQRRLTIVGTVTLPSFGVTMSDHVSLGQGAMMSEQALLRAEGASLNRKLLAAGDVPQSLPSAVAIDLAPGTTAAQRARLVHVITAANPDGTPGGTYQLTQYRAAAIQDASQMGSQPLALALGLAAAAVLSLALTVLASVRRRRRELALLKTLGMTRRQLRAVVGWQTTLTLLIALALGLPLGIAAGRLAWRAFAGLLGVVPVTVVPVLVLAAGAAVLAAAGNVLAAVPATVAARTDPATALRAE
jgi:ABC-type lipoprotein release transport system permease subunit